MLERGVERMSCTFPVVSRAALNEPIEQAESWRALPITPCVHVSALPCKWVVGEATIVELAQKAFEVLPVAEGVEFVVGL